MGMKLRGDTPTDNDDLVPKGYVDGKFVEASKVTVQNVVTGSESRPLGFVTVIWLGGATRPINMANGDIWFSTSAQVTPTAPSITTTTLTSMTNGNPYSQTLATTGTTPMTFAVTSGTLPSWMTLNTSTGSLSGTPNATGAYDFTITATNSVGSSTPRRFQGTVGASGTAPSITTTTLPAMTQNQAYDSGAMVVTGSTPITFGISAGTIPAGLSINSSTGAISGTPTGSGAYNFTVQGTNDFGNDTQQFTGTITAAGGGGGTNVSIHGATPLTLTSHEDADPGSWVSQQYYVPNTGLSLASKKIVGARLYVPAGSIHIGQPWRAGLIRNPDGIWLYGTAPNYTDFDSNGSKVEGSTLVAGWNEVLFATQYPCMANGQAWVIGVQIGANGNRYLYDTTTTATSIFPDGGPGNGANFVLSEDGGNVAGQSQRGFYRGAAVSGSGFGGYGIDTIVEI